RQPEEGDGVSGPERNHERRKACAAHGLLISVISNHVPLSPGLSRRPRTAEQRASRIEVAGTSPATTTRKRWHVVPISACAVTVVTYVAIRICYRVARMNLGRAAMNCRVWISAAIMSVAAIVPALAQSLPDAIAAKGETMVLTAHAEGAQVYDCKA